MTENEAFWAEVRQELASRGLRVTRHVVQDLPEINGRYTAYTAYAGCKIQVGDDGRVGDYVYAFTDHLGRFCCFHGIANDSWKPLNSDGSVAAVANALHLETLRHEAGF